jgi:hypothetical protein
VNYEAVAKGFTRYVKLEGGYILGDLLASNSKKPS